MTEEETYRLLRRSPITDVVRDLLYVWHIVSPTMRMDSFYSFVAYDHCGNSNNTETMQRRDDVFAQHYWTRQEFVSALYPKLSRKWAMSKAAW